MIYGMEGKQSLFTGLATQIGWMRPRHVQVLQRYAGIGHRRYQP